MKKESIKKEKNEIKNERTEMTKVEVKSEIKKDNELVKSKTDNYQIANDDKNKLLIVIVNRGFAENVIETSRLEGATGATIISGRGSAGVGETFMGMSITPEKEVILIIIKQELADAAMKRIAATFGITSTAGGFCFCLPVNAMTRKIQEQIEENK